MESSVRVVDDTVTSSEAVNLGEREKPFWNFNDFMEEHYKKVQGIQKFQLLRMTKNKPGQVECRRRVASEPVWFDLNRAPPQDPPVLNFAALWKTVQKRKDPPPNPEKIYDTNKMVLPFVLQLLPLTRCIRSQPLSYLPTHAKRNCVTCYCALTFRFELNIYYCDFGALVAIIYGVILTSKRTTIFGHCDISLFSISGTKIAILWLPLVVPFFAHLNITLVSSSDTFLTLHVKTRSASCF